LVSPDSSLSEYYPQTFSLDYNFKKNDWEAVVLIPFINAEALIEATNNLESHLTPEEKSRNRFHEPEKLSYGKHPGKKKKKKKKKKMNSFFKILY